MGIINGTIINNTIVKNEVAQSYPTLCDPTGCSLLDFSIHRIFQTRGLEWVAIPFSRDLPNPGIEPGSPALQTDALPSEPPGKPILLLFNSKFSLYLRTAQENQKLEATGCLSIVQ